MVAIDSCISKIESARKLLQEAEKEGLIALDKFKESNFQLLPILEEAIHQATHEIESSLGFAVSDLSLLNNKIQCRLRYSIFTDQEFDKITTTWSVSLVDQIHKIVALRQSISLKEVSDIIKRLIKEWSEIGEIVGKYT